MLKDVTNISAALSVLSPKKRLTIDDSEQLPKRRRTKPNSSKSVLEAQALANHKRALEQNHKGIAGLQCGFFYMRAPKSPGNKTPTKYAALATGPIDAAQFETDLGETKQFRPCVPEGLSPGGRVISVKTPKGTELPLTLDLGAIRVFSSEKTKVKRNEIDPAVIPTDNAVVTPPRANYKTQYLRLGENLRSSKKRKHGQSDIMHRKGLSVKNASATKVAERAGIALAEERYEWLHLICHRMKGAQNKDNLVAGTFHANTLMIPVEAYLPHLKKYIHSEVSLHVSAELIPNTHIAKTIHYVIRIEQPDGSPTKEIAFKFDALLATAPSRRIKIAVDVYMQNLLKQEQLEQCAVELALERLSAQVAEDMDLAPILSEEDTSEMSLMDDDLCFFDNEDRLIPCRLDFSGEPSEALSSDDFRTVPEEYQSLSYEVDDFQFISVDSAFTDASLSEVRFFP